MAGSVTPLGRDQAAPSARTADAGSPPPRQRRALLRYQRSRETRERLALEASRLWGERSFDAVTVDDICDRAGVSRSAYYFHFPNKEALLAELDLVTARHLAAEMRARWQDGEPTLEADLEAFLDGLVRRATHLPRELFARAMETAMRGLAYVGRLEDREADFGRVLAECFARAQSRGELPPSEDPGEMAAVLSAMVMEGLLRWAHGTAAVRDLEEVLRWRTSVFLAGVRARPTG